MLYYLFKIFKIRRKILITLTPYWMKLIFSCNNITYGSNMLVKGLVYISIAEKAKVTIGDGFKFTSGLNINPLCRNLRGSITLNSNATLIIKNNVGCSSTCIWVHERIEIGNNVNIGGNVILMDSDAHSLNYLDRRVPKIDMEMKKNAPIIIEDDVLIGANSIILKGVTVGARSIIGAGSVVTKSIPSDCIAGGNPCRVIKRM